MTKEELEAHIEDIAHLVHVQAKRISELEKKEKKGNGGSTVTVSLDLWPMRDWFRLEVDDPRKYSEQGYYWQALLGPVRVDVFDS